MCYMIESVMVIVWTHLPWTPHPHPFTTHTHTVQIDWQHTQQSCTLCYSFSPLNAKHHILLQPSKRFRKRITSAVISTLRWSWEGLLISARCCGCQMKSLWILICLFLLEPKYDLSTQSQRSLIRRQRDSVMMAQPGCVLTWPRFRSPQRKSSLFR